MTALYYSHVAWCVPGKCWKNRIPHVAMNFKRILKQGLIIMLLRGSLLHCYYCDPVYIVSALHLEKTPIRAIFMCWFTLSLLLFIWGFSMMLEQNLKNETCCSSMALRAAELIGLSIYLFFFNKCDGNQPEGHYKCSLYGAFLCFKQALLRTWLIRLIS